MKLVSRLQDSSDNSSAVSESKAPRRIVLAGLAALAGARTAHAFGDVGAFNPRVVVSGGRHLPAPRSAGPSGWSMELINRTSAPARLVPREVGLDKPELCYEPFALWAGDS